jgi:predicted nucleotidyltransferase
VARRDVGRLDDATRALMAMLRRRLRQRFGDRLKGLILFGSRARGDHSADSDADVAVVLAGPIDRAFPIKCAIIDDTYDLFLESKILIQPWPLAEGWLDDPTLAPHPHIVASVLREGIDW